MLFVGGFSVAFVAMGLLAASFGSLLVAYRPVLETVAGIAMLGMGAFLLNWLPTPWTAFLQQEWRLAAPTGVIGGAAPFGLGVLFAAGWTPCIGPVLGAILAYAGASASLALGAGLMVVYSLGFAVPFLAIGLGWSVGLRALGWVKQHGDVVTRVSGVALVVVGLLYLTGQVEQISIWTQHLAGPKLG
jgi:cytochrome c-type biogenesis protein